MATCAKKRCTGAEQREPRAAHVVEIAQRCCAAPDAARRCLPRTRQRVREPARNGSASDRDDAALERLRIGTVLANAPQLIDAIPLGAGQQIFAMAISPDGESVAAVIGGRTIHLFDVASGKQRWQVTVPPQSFGMTAMGLTHGPLEVHFSDDGHRLVGRVEPLGAAGGMNPALYPHDLDSVLIDVDTGKLVAPPEQFADFLAVDYSDNGRYALLFDKRGHVQRWRTSPWAADGDLARL